MAPFLPPLLAAVIPCTPPHHTRPWPPQPPLFHRAAMDLLKLFRAVYKQGGHDEVVRHKGWGEAPPPPCCLSAQAGLPRRTATVEPCRCGMGDLSPFQTPSPLYRGSQPRLPHSATLLTAPHCSPHRPHVQPALQHDGCAGTPV